VDDLDNLDPAILEAGFLKAKNSQSFFARFGEKAFRPGSDLEATRDLVRKILSAGEGVVLQEFVPGPADHQICVDGFIDSGGVIRGMFARRWLRKHAGDFGESSMAVSIPLGQVSAAVDLVERFLGSLPYRGLFSAELKVDRRDGKYHLLEVNARPWWYIQYTCRAGVDVLKMTHQDSLQQPVATTRTYDIDSFATFPSRDRYAYRQQPPGERESWPRLLWRWLKGFRPVFHWDDPGPAIRVSIGRVQRRSNRLRDNHRKKAANRR
jgi:predicted ATP-grasp superfamily ATP-dependent carboligase